MTVKSTIFCGCSYTQGIGLKLIESDPDLWVNIIHGTTPHLAKTQLINRGIGGYSNEQIFLSAVKNVLDNDCSYLFVAWTSLNRLTINPSVETYTTSVYLERAEIPDININPNLTISGKYIENIRDRFFDLTHEHYALVKILEYTALIDKLCRSRNIRVFFINAILPTDPGYFVHVIEPERLPSETTPHTQKNFNLATRDDNEYWQIYDKAHQAYQDTGGLSCDWLNLDHGFRKHFYVDKGVDNLHPGPTSHKLFGNFIQQKLLDHL